MHKFLGKAQEPNVVQPLVKVENLHIKNAQRWIHLCTNQWNDFPILELNYWKDLTTVTYQIRLAPSFIQDKFHGVQDK